MLFFIENHPRSKNLFLNAITEIKSEQDSIIDKLIKEVKVEEEPEPYYFDIGLEEDTENFTDDYLKSECEQPISNHSTNNDIIIPEPVEVIEDSNDKKVHKCHQCNESFVTLVKLGYHQNRSHRYILITLLLLIFHFFPVYVNKQPITFLFTFFLAKWQVNTNVHLVINPSPIVQNSEYISKQFTKKRKLNAPCVIGKRNLPLENMFNYFYILAHKSWIEK